MAFDSQILVVHENVDLTLYDHLEPVTAADVQTPQEVYDELIGEHARRHGREEGRMMMGAWGC
jgi:hypothetical protein